MIRDKIHLKKLVEENLPAYGSIERYYKKVLQHLLNSPKSLRELLEIPMIRYLATKNEGVANFDKYVNEKSFTNIERPVSRLKSNFEAEYFSVTSELVTAKDLYDEGLTDISFLSQSGGNPDLQFTRNGMIQYVEVKDLMTLNPEFQIVLNKFEAESVINPLYARTFLVNCEYSGSDFSDLPKLHTALKEAVDILINTINPKLSDSQDLESEVIQHQGIKLRLESKSEKTEFLLILSGNAFVYSTPEDSFLDLYSVYIRFISSFYAAYKQLLSKRDGNSRDVKRDRIYIYLNIDKYNNFIPQEAKAIFENLSRDMGLDRLVDLKLVL